MKENQEYQNNTDEKNKSDLQENLIEQEAQIRAKSELIDNMIYQIRTLSNAVIGFSDLLLTESLTQDQGDYVKEIHDAGEGLSILAGNVLDWTQLLSGKLQFTKTKCNLHATLQELEKYLVSAADERGLSYELMADSHLPAYILTDQNHLLKCLISLAANAVNRKSEGQVQIQAVLENTEQGSFVRFDVIDPNQGLSAEKVSGFFDSKDSLLKLNQQVNSVTGHNLTVTTSLPLTKMLCDLLGAMLDIHEETNVGSIFSLRVPTGVDIDRVPKIQTSDFENDIQTNQPKPQPESVSGCVLLVEDQQSNRIVITLMLESLGMQVDTAENGLAAIEKVDPDKHQLILMDLKMPKMDGYEATKKLREKGYSVPIVALSAKVLNESEHKHIEELFDGFLTKPVNSSQLSEAVIKYCNKTTKGSERKLVCSTANAFGSGTGRSEGEND